MSDMQTIKDRIRKLMNVAGDGVATDGEIANAVSLAMKLMDAHHLTREDIGDDQPEAPEEITFGRSAAVTLGVNLTTWESVLCSAICNLFGSVKCYRSGELAIRRVNGMCSLDSSGNPRRGTTLQFYGPALEAQEAAELFAEWSTSIAAMGVARWGGCVRGDGGMYCYGFAGAIYKQVQAQNTQRQLQAARPLKMLDGKAVTDTATTSMVLRDRFDMLKQAATEWLEEEEGVHLGKSTTRRASYSGSVSAYAEGSRHGSQAGFGRKASRKLLGA